MDNSGLFVILVPVLPECGPTFLFKRLAGLLTGSFSSSGALRFLVVASAFVLLLEADVFVRPPVAFVAGKSQVGVWEVFAGDFCAIMIISVRVV